jgi:acyl-coenzyme A synthetase/AMP-(fatty) acid ligase
MAGTYFSALTATPISLSPGQIDSVLVRLRNAGGNPLRISRCLVTMNNVTATDPKILLKATIADNGTGTTTTGMIVAATGGGETAPSSVSLYSGGTIGSNSEVRFIQYLNTFNKDADFPGTDGLWLPNNHEMTITYTSGTFTGSPIAAIVIMGEQ